MAIIFLLFFGWSFIIASKNVFGIYQKWEKRSQYIITQKENGNTNITVKAPIPAPDKHTALFGMVDLLPDSEIWPNTDIAKYYGIELITGEENKEPW
ncbi:hypothetical protein AGMMS50268_01440 [Spirochaetia bacterium]|nr:hypothetical protein AGMMS50268_01440 [Spirochaetia bacterium]